MLINTKHITAKTIKNYSTEELKTIKVGLEETVRQMWLEAIFPDSIKKAEKVNAKCMMVKNELFRRRTEA